MLLPFFISFRLAAILLLDEYCWVVAVAKIIFDGEEGEWEEKVSPNCELDANAWQCRVDIAITTIFIVQEAPWCTCYLPPLSDKHSPNIHSTLYSLAQFCYHFQLTRTKNNIALHLWVMTLSNIFHPGNWQLSSFRLLTHTPRLHSHLLRHGYQKYLHDLELTTDCIFGQ